MSGFSALEFLARHPQRDRGRASSPGPILTGGAILVNRFTASLLVRPRPSSPSPRQFRRRGFGSGGEKLREGARSATRPISTSVSGIIMQKQGGERLVGSGEIKTPRTGRTNCWIYGSVTGRETGVDPPCYRQNLRSFRERGAAERERERS